MDRPTRRIDPRPKRNVQMTVFTYLDNSHGQCVDGKWVAPVLFEVVAEWITDADRMFEESIGIDTAKAKHIGCRLSKLGVSPAFENDRRRVEEMKAAGICIWCFAAPAEENNLCAGCGKNLELKPL